MELLSTIYLLILTGTAIWFHRSRRSRQYGSVRMARGLRVYVNTAAGRKLAE